MKRKRRGEKVTLNTVLLWLTLIVLFFGFMLWQEQRRQNQNMPPPTTFYAEQARDIFAANLTLAQVLQRCSALWDQLNPRVYQRPIALAWQRNGLDAFVLRGDNVYTVRHVRCDAQGVRWGARFSRPLYAPLPAESAVRPGDTDALQIPNIELREPLIAVELLKDPETGQTFQRTWSGPELHAQMQPENAWAFPLLMQPALASNTALTPLGELPAQYWNENPRRAFELLAHELPADAKIVELNLLEDKIDVSILGPIPGFDKRGPQPYGDKSFDEYGVAENSYWYPREIPGFACRQGLSLEEVIARFKAEGGVDGPIYFRAWFSCSPAYSDGKNGRWSLSSTP
jgi:hypothetical protein